MINFKQYNNITEIKIPNNVMLSTTDFNNTFRNMTTLINSVIPHNKLTNMSYTYYNCRNLTGSPVCGNNVTNMSYAYYGCTNLTGSPVCGSNVTNMGYAYVNCYNLTGSPVCGSNTNMVGAYINCYNLTGSPVCGSNVDCLYYTYANCRNLSGNMYIYQNIVNVSSCFLGKNNSKIINIYAYNNTMTWDNLYESDSTSLVGANITWTNSGNGFYNSTYNIYVYSL